MGYDAATLVQKFVWSTTDPTTGNNKGAIWQSGGGPAADDAGNIYLETANGEFDANSGGSNYGDSVVKLDPKEACWITLRPLTKMQVLVQFLPAGLSERKHLCRRA